MPRYDDPYRRGYEMGPQWGRPHPLDPNWSDGDYHGQRMGWDHRQGAYGFLRQHREHDLGGHGGFDGRYDEPEGRYGRDGLWRHPMDAGRVEHPHSRHLPYDRDLRRVEDGGVRAGNQYLRQYNANSPELRRGYDRGYGWAPGPSGEGRLTRAGLRGDTRERGYAGYNRGGFAEGGGAPGLDPRK
ncbi:MAG TPA: hypothetical protein VFQ45_11465 [Longimicrobium sp.]|nr:hypothetical protein [Longimicrobium sp.]